MPRPPCRAWTAFLAAVCLCPAPAAAEQVFHLRSGGLIEGRQATASPDGLRVETRPGLVIGLAAGKITRVQVIWGPSDFLRWQQPLSAVPPPRPLANPLPPVARSTALRIVPPATPRRRAGGRERSRSSYFEYYQGPVYGHRWYGGSYGYVVRSHPALYVNGHLIYAAEPPHLVVFRRPSYYLCDQ